MHTRDYSDETARVIDEEVERILRDEEAAGPQDARASTALGLDAVARALLEHETIDGAEVGRLVDEAMGRKAGGFRKIRHADGTVTEVRHADGASVAAAGRARTLSPRGHPVPVRGRSPGERTSASAAHRSVALTAPTNARCTTPSASATRIIGIAAIS